MSVPRNGILHKYTSKLSAFEHLPDASSSPQNLVIFIGGLFDGLTTVPYTSTLTNSLGQIWSLAEIILSSSYNGWGVSSLQNDVNEISKCVEYFHKIKSGLIVLMGHSTGCQDIMEYLTGFGHQTRSPINGCIIQAPVSDREYLVMSLDPQIFEQSCLEAQAMVDSDKDQEIIPYRKEIYDIFPCPISAQRWLSLASPNKNGDDDYFSSDLTTEQLMNSFGKLPTKTPICILISGADQYMPPSIEKNTLLTRWTNIITKSGGKYDPAHSGVIKDATHNLSDNNKDVIRDLANRVTGFLATLNPSTK
ncbi:UPF0613 protein PB24D3.06c [Golovinomyces cichoracearum]|uniref:UPF0613 protein PB24D3.06c n=1 Tax=Golovinomyces cichoracearum TaxID=62708 RepID=A0A420IDB4_9PEZI|nr:UPF0613 protein PB24D3.06c [Golovinomyces cichoracearum]